MASAGRWSRPRRRRTISTQCLRRSVAPLASRPSRTTYTTPWPPWSVPSSWPRPLASTSSNGSSETSARNGRRTGRTSPPSRSTGISPFSDVTGPEALGRALAAAPDPELARVALSRVGERREARDALEQAIEPAVQLLGFSSAAADFLVAHPEEAVLFTGLAARTRDMLMAEVET